MSNSKTVKTSLSYSSQSFDRLWQNICNNPTDFNQWTYLLQYCEHMKNIALIRKAYNRFLYDYPLCYIYWQKFADFELEYSNNTETALDVLERGVTAFPLSVSLWIHYLNIFIKLKNTNEKEIIKLFDRAINACGLDFNSSDLWELYITWLSTHRDLSEVTHVFDQLLKTPTFKIKQHMESFTTFVNDNNPICIISKQEYNSYNIGLIAYPTKKCLNPTNNHKSSDLQQFTTKINDSHTKEISEENLAKIRNLRAKIIKKRLPIYELTLNEFDERICYEEKIKRPYFHVNPLDLAQLNNWMDYINWAISKQNETQDHTDDHNERTITSDIKIVFLFERCLVSCALYEHMWMRYANYLIEKQNQDIKDNRIHCAQLKDIREVFKRGCDVHVRKSVKLHYLWSLFEEKEGNIKEAILILEKFEKENPNIMEITLHKINLYHRNGDIKTVDALFKSAIEKTLSNPKLSSHLSVKYSRFCFKTLDDTEAAIGALNDALTNDPTNYNLYFQLIDIEYQRKECDFSKIENLFDEAISASNNVSIKLSMIQRKLEFMQDFAFNCQKIQTTIYRMQNLMHGLNYEHQDIENNGYDYETANCKRLKLSEDLSPVSLKSINSEVLYNCIESTLT